jgi:two-component system, cell cycle response regulator
MKTTELNLLKTIKVLYVEDEKDIQTITADVLRSVCGEVICASDGLDALSTFEEHGDFDILVTDLNMPKMDGITLIGKIRVIDKSFPVIITTAHTEINFLHDAINLGVNGYTLKPIDLKKLISAIAKAVESRILRKELENFNSSLIAKVKEQTFELNSILDSQDSLIAVSYGKKITVMNKRFLSFLGVESLEELNNDISSVCDLFIKEDGYYFKNITENGCCFSQINLSTNTDIFVKMKNSYGVVCVFKLNINTYDFNGVHFIMSLTDITILKEQSDLLQYQANHDSLTGLYNRQYLNDILQNEISRAARYEHHFIIAMFDIDYFKAINDNYGHDIGDEVLQNLSNLVKKYLRDTDTIARWGGEEFMIIMAETDIENGFEKINNLRELISQTQLSPSVNKSITVSFGLTTFKQGDTKNDIAKRVDIALYEAKNSGRNMVIQK